MRIRPRWRSLVAVLVSTAVANGVLLAAAPAAHADPTRYLTCSASGYTGTLRIDYIQRTPGTEYVPGGVAFRINPGARPGNNADVIFTDGGTLPARTASTTTGWQDGRWHWIGPPAYTRGNGPTTVQFVFDRLLSTDPRCTDSINW